MSYEPLFSVVIIDGCFTELSDPATSLVRYDGLSHDEAWRLSEVSAAQGFQVVLWAMPKESAGSKNVESGCEACGEA